MFTFEQPPFRIARQPSLNSCNCVLKHDLDWRESIVIIILIIVLVLVFGGGGGYYGYGRWGTGGGAGIGLGTILVILLICYFLGAFR